MLPVLRFTALFLVLLLLFDPVWRRVTRTGEAPLLAVLVDDSESLTLGAGPPADAVRAALDGLPADAALRFYRFGAEAAPAGRALPGDSLRFAGERTDIAAALGRVEADFAGRNLRGVVLVSDGRVTDGRNPAYLAERFPVPIWTAVAGDSVSGRDVRLARAVTNDVAYARSPLPVQVGVRASGYAGQTAPVTISENGRVLTRGAVELPAGGAEAVVDLTVTPAAPGVRRYTVAVGPLAGEATTRNNTAVVEVRVLDDRRRVLVVAGAPDPDLAALRAALEADRSLDVTVRTQRAPGLFYEGALPARLGAFDLLVLAGYPGPAADGQTAERLAASGLPVLFVLTRQTDLSLLARAFGDVLPAAPAAVRAGFAEAGLAPTPAGEAHPVFEGLGVDASRLSALPPVAVTTSRWTLAPGARSLAGVRRGGAALDVPLVAVRAGARRSAAVLGAGTWRWRTLPDDLGDLRGAYDRLLDNLVRWTTAPQDRRRVRVRPDRALFGERDRVTLTGQAYGESLEPISDARLTVAVRAPSGDVQREAMRPVGNGRYVVDLGVRPAGTYTFTAEAERGGVELGTDRGSFGVGALAAEFREPGADPALLRQVAARSGGAVVGLDTLGSFVAGLRERGALADRPLVREDETPLVGLPWLLALAVALLTAEWVIRKRAGMV
ncbi:hypothetical protein RQM47_08425 [Rubrivirga sp. S365]|uniref:VWA domain-containing protein n=1 Tax=Rubrivirga litoralis TaxID=3075598 RepID=A0ABU3BPJ0_9BACT|nr:MULTISPECIES: hypothetical protein [unclassified Rubrivirga]MDT0631194.1 hypothetical protein [Rubrivirga sp. F394]MDT7856663.1 hypothetical protein [Rubrivirga sp. S365]